jgi:cobalt-zinc-cadmium efflux system membrane fusion protein
MLKIGMFVTATLESKEDKKFAEVPAPSVLHLHDRDWVFVPAGGNQFRRVEVRTGEIVNGKQAILSGIQSGQQVVSNVLQLETTLENQ